MPAQEGEGWGGGWLPSWEEGAGVATVRVAVPNKQSSPLLGRSGSTILLLLCACSLSFHLVPSFHHLPSPRPPPLPVSPPVSTCILTGCCQECAGRGVQRCPVCRGGGEGRHRVGGEVCQGGGHGRQGQGVGRCRGCLPGGARRIQGGEAGDLRPPKRGCTGAPTACINVLFFSLPFVVSSVSWCSFGEAALFSQPHSSTPRHG